MSRSDPTDKMGAPVEILYRSDAHHRQALLQLGQVLPAQYIVGRSGTPGHNREYIMGEHNAKITQMAVANVSTK